MPIENPFDAPTDEKEVGGAENIEGGLDREIEAELLKLENNAENLKNKVADYGEEDMENLDKEKRSGLIENTKKIIYGLSALVALGAASGLVPLEKINELNQMAKDFVNQGNNAFIIVGLMAALTLPAAIYEVWQASKKNKE